MATHRSRSTSSSTSRRLPTAGYSLRFDSSVRFRRTPRLWVGAVFVLGIAGMVLFYSSLKLSYETKNEQPFRPVPRCAQRKPRQTLQSNSNYIPSAIESLVSENALELGYCVGDAKHLADGCNIWKKEGIIQHSNSGIATNYSMVMETYRTKELPEYNRLLQAYLNDPQRGGRRASMSSDLRDELRSGGSHQTVCGELELHQDGLMKGIFPESGKFMLSELRGRQGYLEPLLPPLRHPGICFDPPRYRLSLEYLVHDFGSMCRTLKPHSRTIFIDMGASLDREAESDIPPAFYITELYQKFGFHFDHIYAYEITPKDPGEIYSQIPDDLKAAYHWYNVGVDSGIDSSNNPFKLLRERYNDDDFVVVKLDIDKGSIENPLTELLLDDDLELFKLVDAFYFEQHVFEEIMSSLGWVESRSGTVQESLSLFENLRQRGIAAHSWI